MLGGAIRKFKNGGSYLQKALVWLWKQEVASRQIQSALQPFNKKFAVGSFWRNPDVTYLIATGNDYDNMRPNTEGFVKPVYYPDLQVDSLDTDLTKVPGGSTKNTYDQHKASQSVDKQVNTNDEIKVWFKRNGYSADKVQKLQQNLKSIGYNVGEIDGKIGPKTIAAIKKFQKDNKLTVDGKVGKQTQAILNKKLSVGNTPASDVAPYSAVPVSLQPVASNIDEHPEFGIETVIANPNSMYGGYFN